MITTAIYHGTMTVGQIKTLYYDQQLSTTEVAHQIDKSVWQVIAFMKKHQLPRRKSAETQQLAYLRRPTSFNKKSKLSPQEQILYISGLMLYWGEGAKNTGSVIDLTNSDPNMIVIFVNFLRKIYQIQEQKLRVLLYCFANQNEDQLKSYWSGLLSIPKNQFLKTYIRQDYDLKKIGKMPYGVAHLRYYDKKLYSQIQSDTDIITRDLLK